MINIKLELDSLTDEEVVNRLKLVADKIETNAAIFTAPDFSFDTLRDDADSLDGLLGQREVLVEQARQLTVQIEDARLQGVDHLGANARYVEKLINTITPPATSVDPIVAAATALKAGMEVQSAPSPVGPMPKVTGLHATQGDSDGEVDLTWNAVKRGLKSFVGELTTDPAGQTGWQHGFVCTRSSFSVPGLTSGTRYWFRAAAVGSAGQGPWSDPVSKVAP